MTCAGIVLSGGASRRMGRTKATIEIDGRAMADRVLDALAAVGASPLLLVGGDHEELSALSAPVLDDRYPGDGPVGGILTALDHLAELGGIDNALVLSCDLADITSDTLWSILHASAGDGHSRVWVAATDRLEPMCALWSVSAREVVRDQFASGERAVHRVIAQLPHTTVTVDAAAVGNVNRPADLPDS